jgi:hypothetical protein
VNAQTTRSSAGRISLANTVSDFERISQLPRILSPAAPATFGCFDRHDRAQDGNGPFLNPNCRRRCLISCACMTLTSKFIQLLQSPARTGLPCFRFCQAYHKRPHSQIRVNHLLYPRIHLCMKYGRHRSSICNLSPLLSRSSQNQSIKTLPFRPTKAPQQYISALLATDYARVRALCQDTRRNIVNARKNGFVCFASQEKGFSGKISYLNIISTITVKDVWQAANSNRVACVKSICLIQR